MTYRVDPGSGLKIASSEFRENVATLCLMTPTSEIELDESDVKLGRLEEQLSAELDRLGLTTVGTKETESVLTELRRTSGGYFNRHWGTIDPVVRNEVVSRFYAEGLTSLGCDAALYLRVVQVEAALANGLVTWDHAQRPALFGLVGYLPAVSLMLSINDRPENEIYFGSGAVHLGAQIESDEFHDPHYEDIDDERYLANDQENKKAIELALHDLSIELGMGRRR